MLAKCVVAVPVRGDAITPIPQRHCAATPLRRCATTRLRRYAATPLPAAVQQERVCASIAPYYFRSQATSMIRRIARLGATDRKRLCIEIEVAEPASTSEASPTFELSSGPELGTLFQKRGRETTDTQLSVACRRHLGPREKDTSARKTFALLHVGRGQRFVRLRSHTPKMRQALHAWQLQNSFSGRAAQGPLTDFFT